jgi:protein XRP2
MEALSQCTVDNIVLSFIFIGPCVGIFIFYVGSVFIRDCTDCTIVVASQQLRLKNCHRMKMVVSCQSQPVIENSNDICFSSYRWFYPGLRDQFYKVGLYCLHNEVKLYDNSSLNVYMISMKVEIISRLKLWLTKGF